MDEQGFSYNEDYLDVTVYYCLVVHPLLTPSYSLCMIISKFLWFYCMLLFILFAMFCFFFFFGLERVSCFVLFVPIIGCSWKGNPYPFGVQNLIFWGSTLWVLLFHSILFLSKFLTFKFLILVSPLSSINLITLVYFSAIFYMLCMCPSHLKCHYGGTNDGWSLRTFTTNALPWQLKKSSHGLETLA